MDKPADVHTGAKISAKIPLVFGVVGHNDPAAEAVLPGPKSSGCFAM